jgi:DNA-binding NarL/FixJ family response regulator
MKPIRVLLADDHTIVREGLVALLEGDNLCDVVAQAADGLSAVEQAVSVRPDVAVIDLSMPRLNGLETVRRIHHALPDTRILVLTHHDEEEYVLPLVEAGASGYLVKDSAAVELRKAVSALMVGQAYFGPGAAKVLAERHRYPGPASVDPYGDLTPREREVFHLVCEGHTTKQIARELDIGVKTAENHRNRVLDKLGLSNTAELVRYAARRGLLD